MNHLIPATRPDLVIITVKMTTCRPRRSQSENQKMGKERRVFSPCLRNKNVVEHMSGGDTDGNWSARNGLQNLGRGLEELEIRGSIKTIQTIARLRSVRILRRVRETRGILLTFRLH